MSKRQRTETTYFKHEVLNAKWYDRITWFLLGMMASALLMLLFNLYAASTMSVPEAERKLHDAVEAYMQATFAERGKELLE